MSDLQARFEQAVVESKQLTSKPDNNTLLQIYSLFKQGSAGDVQGDRPGMMDFVGRAKYDAWAALKGKGQAEAQQAYIDLSPRSRPVRPELHAWAPDALSMMRPRFFATSASIMGLKAAIIIPSFTTSSNRVPVTVIVPVTPMRSKVSTSCSAPSACWHSSPI